LKSYVEEDLDEAFELRKCRRTFGQRALNEGHNIHNVSLVMGHSTLATTQRYYCDKEQRSASAEMREHWSKNGSPEDVPGA
nr:site-specific integrase [Candidatus Methanomethylophilaceae archaeon]